MRSVIGLSQQILSSVVWFVLLGWPVFPVHAEVQAVHDEPRHVSLENLLTEAFLKSPGLAVKKRAYEAAGARVISAWLPDDPAFGVDVEGQPDLFQFGKRTNVEYMVTQTIPFPTKLVLRAQVALREAERAFQEYKEQERDIAWHIEQPYYELLLTRKTLAALNEIEDLLEKLHQAVRSRYESNQASQADLLKIQIERSRLEIDVFNQREKEHLAEAHFSHILNQPLDTHYVLAEESRSAPLSRSRSELEQLALRTRPELKALEVGIRRAKASRVLALTNWLPDLTGRLEARQFKGEGGIREYDTFLGVTVPVWSLLKGSGGEWKAASREVEAAHAQYDEMKNEVLLAVHEAYSKVQSSEKALQAYEQAILPQAKSQVDVAFASYQAGKADFLTLIDAQRTLKEAQITYAHVQADYEIGLSNLRLAVGDKLRPTEKALADSQGGTL